MGAGLTQDAHRLLRLRQGVNPRLAQTVNNCWPGFQSAGHNPPACSASSTRRVSSTLRPTFMSWTT